LGLLKGADFHLARSATLDDGAGNDALTGKGGFDSADYRAAASAVRLSTDRVANDGRATIGERRAWLDATDTRTNIEAFLP
jgi:hypothetical protein